MKFCRTLYSKKKAAAAFPGLMKQNKEDEASLYLCVRRFGEFHGYINNGLDIGLNSDNSSSEYVESAKRKPEEYGRSVGSKQF